MKGKGIFILGFILICFSSFAFAGWERTYGGSDDEVAYSLIQTSEGGYLITGYTNSFGVGNLDIYLVKTNENGDTVWTRTYGGRDYDQGHDIIQTIDGGYVITGIWGATSYGHHWASGDVFLLKIDTEGNYLWLKIFGSNERDWGYSVVQTLDGGYAVLGYTDFGPGRSDAYLIRTDSLGNMIWERTYGGEGEQVGEGILQKGDGGFILLVNNDHRINIISTDRDGDIIWEHAYSAGYSTLGHSICATSDSGYFVAGDIDYYDDDDIFEPIYLLKIDAEGNVLWERRYPLPIYDPEWCTDVWAESAIQVRDGGYIIVGEAWINWCSEGTAFLLKVDREGSPLWACKYGCAGHSWFSSVLQCSDEDYVIVGTTNLCGAGGDDFYLIKTDSLGYTGIEETQHQIPIAISLFTYPNPFNSSVRIELTYGNCKMQNENCKVQIYNLGGHKIAELPSDKTVWTPGKDLPAGMYFVRARVGEQTRCKKILYIK
ncbi:MAG: hypothetical protein DRZ76_02875 [Candidatus Nealsonbacteria bacterium]|nr:MAG: hypothetical protein DRZ76_02875 [Candidatus Nealsonbacteria bacterium]